jgi:hypothetical protein
MGGYPDTAVRKYTDYRVDQSVRDRTDRISGRLRLVPPSVIAFPNAVSANRTLSGRGPADLHLGRAHYSEPADGALRSSICSVRGRSIC